MPPSGPPMSPMVPPARAFSELALLSVVPVPTMAGVLARHAGVYSTRAALSADSAAYKIQYLAASACASAPVDSRCGGGARRISQPGRKLRRRRQ
jgi:hypothetical protein